jgi:hypothetical protein
MKGRSRIKSDSMDLVIGGTKEVLDI